MKKFTKNTATLLLLSCFLLISTVKINASEKIDRPVKVVSLCFPPNVNEFSEILKTVDQEGAKGTNIIVLPETWRGDQLVETIEGESITELVFRLALQPNEANKAWEAANLVREELEKRSNGRIRVMFYPSGVLGNERQLLETCYLGIVEMVQVTSSVVTTLDPTFDTLDMPYLFLDEDHHQKVLNGKIGGELLENLNKNELQGLAFYSCGFRNIYANKPIHTPADLKGMKIRVMESPVMIESLTLMGASATPLSSSEVFTALKTGVVDGAENNANVFVSAAHIEAVKHYSLTKHFANQHVLVANKKWLDNIKEKHPDLHELICSVPRDVIAEYNKRWDNAVQLAFQDIIKQDGTITEIKKEDILKFMKKVQLVYESKKETVPPGLVNRIRKEAEL